MPKIRSRMKSNSLGQPVKLRVQEQVVPPHQVQERERFWCPVCGQMADDVFLEESPYPVETVVQRYGGRVKLTEEERAMGVRPRGYMEYVADPGRREAVLQRLLAITDHLHDWLTRELERRPGSRGGRS